MLTCSIFVSNNVHAFDISEIQATTEQVEAAREIVAKFEGVVQENFTVTEAAYLTDFYIFVSSSLPDNLLKQMVVLAKQYSGILVMRGLINNSVRETVNYIQKFVTDTGEGIIIDPTLFERYQIKLVPSFVLNRTDTDEFDIIKGIITPNQALLQFSKRGRLKKEALERLGQ